MAETIEARIQKARPRLSLIAPLTNAVILAFSFGNILIGYGLFQTLVSETTRRVPIVTGLFTFQLYGVIFILLGLVMLYGWYTNHWIILRRSLIAGIFIKSVWTVSLIFSVVAGVSIAILGAWLTLLAIQIATYIFFIVPPRSDANVK